MNGKSINIDLPVWLDDQIANGVLEKLNWLRSSATEEQRETAFPVLKRLATDPRMRDVWRQFSRRKRSKNVDPTFVHTATVTSEVLSALGLDGSDARQSQCAGARVIFDLTFFLSTLPIVPFVRARIQPSGLLGSFTIKRLEDLPVSTEALDLPKPFSESPYIRSLMRRAVFSLWQVVLCETEIGLAVSRKSAIRNPRTRCVGMGVAAICRELFGSYLYGTTATITSVAVGKSVRHAQIREWCSQVADTDALPHRANSPVA